MALQYTREQEQNRSFIQVIANALQQSPTTITYQFIDNDSPQTIYASNDPKEFMITSPDSPPVQIDRNDTNSATTKSPDFKSSKSTPKIDKAVDKIHKLHDNTARFNNPQVIFLDSDARDQEQHDIELKLQQEQEKLEREQANIISIIPAPQEQDNTMESNKDTFEETEKPTGKEPQKTNTEATKPTTTDNKTNQLVKENNTNPQVTNMEQQPIERAENIIQKSHTSSTTSQEYCTPPLSPTSEISDINSDDIEALSETL